MRLKYISKNTTISNSSNMDELAPQNTVQTNGLSLVNKILVGLFIILLLVISGELVFYFFIGSKNINQGTTVKPLQITPQINSTTSTDGSVSPTPKLDEYGERQLMAKENVLVSSNLVDQFKATLVAVDTIPGIREDFPYQLRFAISVDGRTIDFLLNQTGVDRLKVFQLVNSQPTPSNLSALKPGDKITIDRILDGTKPKGDNVIKFDITKQ